MVEIHFGDTVDHVTSVKSITIGYGQTLKMDGGKIPDQYPVKIVIAINIQPINQNTEHYRRIENENYN